MTTRDADARIVQTATKEYDQDSASQSRSRFSFAHGQRDHGGVAKAVATRNTMAP